MIPTDQNLLLEKFIKLYGCRPTEFDRRYLELLEMGRFRVVAVPDVSPGKCCNCGASRNDGRKYLDTGRHVEWYGAIFFCGLCLREYAEAMGLFDTVKAELQVVKEQILDQEIIDTKKEELEALVLKTFEEIKAIYVSVHPDSDEFFPDSDADLEHEPSAENESAAPKSKSRTTKSTSGTGRTDIPSLANLLNS